MKNLLLTLSLLISLNLFAQVPEGIPYQAVARDASGAPLDNYPINVRFSILDSIATGQAVYTETHTTNTNNLGSFTVNLGKGTPVLNSFTSINWGINSKFLKVEIDTSSGSNYIEIGTQQMMSVPYALYAFNASFSANGVPVGKHREFCISCWGKAVWTSNGNCPQISSSLGTPNLHSAILSYGNLYDVEGNPYKTVKIGPHIWMAENLRTKHYSNGDSIISMNSSNTNDSIGRFAGESDGMCSLGGIYGLQYNWFATTDNRNVCPTGWHVSTKTEWDTILNIVGTGTFLSQFQGNETALTYQDAGTNLRPIGNNYWNGNYWGKEGDNLVGFSAVATGAIEKTYLDWMNWECGSLSSWWSNNPISSNTPLEYVIYINGVDDQGYVNSASHCATVESQPPSSYSSIRCVKD
jgi:uncharacterized protein (TIGR02145 family)